jgi:DNA repair protein RecN (Recombination protein N)
MPDPRIREPAVLSQLRIRNFALIDDVTVQLGPGLNVLTGETGAGKSIVVGALSLLLGERASSEAVRAGAERASVEGMFEIEGREDLLRWLEERGVEAEDGILILKREVAVEGRNRAWINGSPATASLLGEIGATLVSLHGQHQHQTLLRRDEQRDILDAYAGNGEVLGRVATAHRELAAATAAIRSLDQRRRDALQRADLLRFQVDEIEGAGIGAGEEERLEEEERRLAHAEELISLTNALLDGLAEGGDSAAGRLGAARRSLEQLVRIDPGQAELSELFDTAYYALEEVGTRLEAYLSVVEHDPRRLEEVRLRRDLLYRLRAKYGPTLDEVLHTLETARRELSLVEDADWELAELERRGGDAERRLGEEAAELSRRRAEAAERLASEVMAVLPALGMEGGRFVVQWIPLEPPGPAGAEEIEFLVTLNRGFEPRPLASVASGGELSRVMLALKTILARVDSVPTLIFDEVDAGVGGRVALQLGDRMRAVGREHQVLAITHLPQIASRAHRHLLVRKEDDGERSVTRVATLEDDERVTEIARMLGGDSHSDASLAHARELLEKARVPAGA